MSARDRRHKLLRVIARDGTRCVWCGRDLAGAADATLDHVWPLIRGAPKTSLWNYVLACEQCNLLRGCVPAWLWAEACEVFGWDLQRDTIAAALERVRDHASEAPRPLAPIDIGWLTAHVPGEPFHA